MGDITENTSLSGFCKAKEILDNLEIPYVVVFGNHDVGTDEEYEQCSKWKGQDYFDQVFWSTTSIPCQNATSTKNFEILLKDFNFQRDEENKDYKNFSFSFGGFNFIGLDFVSREKFMKIGPGVGPDAVLNEINENWLKEKLEEFKESPIILFAHHPLKKELIPIEAFSPLEILKIEKIIKSYNAYFDFGGHIHSFEEIHGKLAPKNANITYPSINNTQVLTTEALMVGSNGIGVEPIYDGKGNLINGVLGEKKGIIRIVKVFDKENIVPYHWETTEKGDEFIGLNPNFDYYPVTSAEGGYPIGYQFIAQSFTERKISQFKWDFGFPIGEKEGKEVFVSMEEIQNGINSGSYQKIGNEVKIPVKLALVDEKTQKEEYIPKQEKVYFRNAYLILGPSINQFTSFNNQQKLTVTAENRNGIEVIIESIHSPPQLIGMIKVNFGQVKENIDLRNLIADTDLGKGKTILYMKKWPDEVEKSKVLYLPIK